MDIQAIVEKIRAKAQENGQDTDRLNQKQAEISTNRTLSNVCELCDGKGFIIKKQENTQDLVITCKCQEVEKVNRMWNSSGINPEQSKQTFGTFIPKNKISEQAKDMAIQFYKDFNSIKDSRHNSIAFLGQVGSGKTHLSIAIAVNFISKGILVVYMPYRDIITQIKQNMLDEEYYQKILNKYKTAQVLLIDDLFKGKITESDINIMFEIINFRYLNNLPIIISSEYTAERILEFDEAVGSRIIQMCKDYTVEIRGKENNYRLKE